MQENSFVKKTLNGILEGKASSTSRGSCFLAMTRNMTKPRQTQNSAKVSPLFNSPIFKIEDTSKKIGNKAPLSTFNILSRCKAQSHKHSSIACATVAVTPPVLASRSPSFRRLACFFLAFLTAANTDTCNCVKIYQMSRR